jgi:hypothetical protein
MVELSVVDGRVVFARWLIRCEIPAPPEAPPPRGREEEDPFWRFIRRLGNHRVERDGVMAYDDAERADIEAGLRELGIGYAVEDISPTPEQASKAGEVEGYVSTRSEALDYIERGVLPERLVMARMRRYVEEHPPGQPK